jgi:tRNA pseudouridine55 synthase
MYSAKKVGGRKLYELARAGADVEREAVTVTISEFESLNFAGLVIEKNDTADLPVRVVCSAGTYIRTLAEDFGKRLGIAAHVAALRRTRAGAFAIETAITLDRLNELVESGSLPQVLITSNGMLAHLPSVKLSDEDAIRTRNGIDLRIEEADSWEDSQLVRLQDMTGNLIAVGKYSHADGIVHPGVVLNEE